MVDTVNSSKPAVSALTDPKEASLQSALEKHLDEERAANKVAQFPGPKELARTKDSPLGAQEGVARPKDNRAPLAEIRPQPINIPGRKQLLALTPEQEIEVFSVEREIKPAPVVRPEQSVAVAPADISSTQSVSRPEQFSPVRETEELTRESSQTELDKINTRQSLETISQAVPAKAGALLDLSV